MFRLLHVISALLFSEGHDYLLRHMIVLSMEVFCHHFFIQVSFLREVCVSTQKHASLQRQELTNQAFHPHLAVSDLNVRPGARKIDIMVYGAVLVLSFVFVHLSNGEV